MTSDDAGPRIYWLNDARRDLQEAISRELSSVADDSPLQRHIERVNDRLRRTFGEADAIIVRQRFRGYTPNPDQDVLFVEVMPKDAASHMGHRGHLAEEPSLQQSLVDAIGRHGGADSTTYIVKLAQNGEKLKSELEAWQSCRPASFRRDAHLSSLESGPTDDRGLPISLLYEDANSVLGTGQVETLEGAFLESIRFGLPRVDSVTSVLRRMYQSLGRRFYSRSYVCEGKELLAEGTVMRRRIVESLDQWRDCVGSVEPGHPVRLNDERRLQRRRETLGLLASRRDTFLDPCEFLQQVVSDPQFANMMCPRLLVGCAHGDLHGRNMFVSVANDDVDSLVVFDYEDFRRDNLVGWDFVKLETELKCRAYPLLCDEESTKGSTEPLVRYIERVHHCEIAVDTWSDGPDVMSRRIDSWVGQDGVDGQPSMGDVASDRLARIVLAIRAAAKEHLGVRRQRPYEWLDEYRFLLACYGVYAARFGSYTERELMAAYISAGTAACAMDFPRRTLDSLIDRARDKAETTLAQARTNPPDRESTPPPINDLTAGLPVISCQIPLEYARVLVRADVVEYRHFVEDGIRFLEDLRHDYPHSIEIEEELSLACMELGGDWLVKAHACLDRVMGSHQIIPEEILCRAGRRYKMLAEQNLDDVGLSKNAEWLFRRALQFYERAYHMRGDSYSGINVATLMYILRQPAAARELAERLLDAVSSDSTESIWSYAIRGEANFLLNREVDCERGYQAALEHEQCQPQTRRSMRRQLELLIRTSNPEIRQAWPAERLEQLFQNKDGQT